MRRSTFEMYPGWKNISTSEAIIIIELPSSMYKYEAPDALELPWDSAGVPHHRSEVNQQQP